MADLNGGFPGGNAAVHSGLGWHRCGAGVSMWLIVFLLIILHRTYVICMNKWFTVNEKNSLKPFFLIQEIFLPVTVNQPYRMKRMVLLSWGKPGRNTPLTHFYYRLLV